jgi:hypothetical protein
MQGLFCPYTEIMKAKSGQAHGRQVCLCWTEKPGKNQIIISIPEKANRILGDNIFDFTEDSQGDLWIAGVVEEIARYSRKEKKLIQIWQ